MASCTFRCTTRSPWHWRTISIWPSPDITCPSPTPTFRGPRRALLSAALTRESWEARREEVWVASERAHRVREPAARPEEREEREQARPVWYSPPSAQELRCNRM